MPKLAEWHIYGNEQQGRFCTRKPEETPLYYLANLTTDVINKNFFRIMDKKEYELKDHLGNVRVAIGDMKIPTGTRGVAPFVVDEKSVSDFYPGGMPISDRSWQVSNYRYGYNGQEKSLEIDASGNHNTAEFWEMGTRELRRWNLDPINQFSKSRYSIFGNDPIRFNDPNGKFEIDKTTAKKYPKLNEYLKNIQAEYQNKPQEFREAFKEYSEMSDKEIEKMLTYGSGPKLKVENLDTKKGNVNGETRIVVKDKKNEKYANDRNGKGLIKLDDDVVKALENATTEKDLKAGKILVESTLFHEGTHFGDVKKDGKIMKDKNGKQIETGKEFEKKVYGVDVDRSNAAQVSEGKK